MMRLGTRRRRKNQTTMMTKNPPCQTVVLREFRESMMSSEVSAMTVVFTSAGRSRVRSARRFFTRSATWTLFDPICFWMIIIRPGLRLTCTSLVTSLKPSSTRATSFR